ncbi:MAG: hypothetical protein IT443_14005 [Phycisphaeraceae bacterium]|nr:hypothetical protein [Phycisphaeraceae bacterium]
MSATIDRCELNSRVTIQALTQGPKHHWFGYYDKCPWDARHQRILAMEADFADRQPQPGEFITLGMVDGSGAGRFVPFDRTSAWSWQQGTMLQWLEGAHKAYAGTAVSSVGVSDGTVTPSGGPSGGGGATSGAATSGGGGGAVIYNRQGLRHYVGVIRNLDQACERLLPRPVYDVSRDGQLALTLDFSRLHRLRPGYGYAGLPDETAAQPAPADAGIWAMDLRTGQAELILSLAWAAAQQPRPDMQGAQHWFNHLTFNPSASRFVFVHRWQRATDRQWQTRLYVSDPRGHDVRLVLDDGMASHFDWRDDDTLLVWGRTQAVGDRFYLIDVSTGSWQVVGDGVLTEDGHCSYSPDRRWIVTDTYPDGRHMRHLMLYRVADRKCVSVGWFYSPPAQPTPCRCDLHPRWDRCGHRLCIDSFHEETRQIYALDVARLVEE